MRRLPLLLFLVLGFLLAAAAALWLLRLPLAEWGLARWLDSRGLAGSAEVLRLDLEGAELGDLVVEGQRARRVRVVYDLPALLGTDPLEGVEAVELEGLRLAADLTSERPLGRLSEAFGGGEPAAGEAGALPALPPVTLSDAEVALETARGPLRLQLDGALAAAPDASPTARRLELAIETLAGPVDLAGRAEGLYRPGDGSGSSLELRLESRQGPPLAVAASVELGERYASLSLDLSGDAPLLAELAALPATARPEAGGVALRGRGAALTDALLAGDATRLLAEPEALRDLDLALTLEDLALAGRGRGLALEAGADLAGSEGASALRLTSLDASADALDPDWLESLGLPTPLAAALAEGASLSVTSPGVAPAVLTLGAEPRLDLDIAATVAPAGGGRLATSLAGTLAAPEALEGQLKGTVSAEMLSLPGLGELDRAEAGVGLSLTPGSSTVELTAPLEIEALTLAQEALAQLDPGWRPLLERPLDLTLGGPGQAGGRLELSGDRLRVALPPSLRLAAGEAHLESRLSGSLQFSTAGVLQDSAVTLEGLSATMLPTPYGLLRSLALSGRVEGVPRAAEGTAQAGFELVDLTVEGASAADLSGELALDLAWDDQAMTLDLAEPGRLAASGFAEPLAPLVERVALTLADARLTLAGPDLRLAASGALEPAALDLDGRGRTDDLVASAPQLTLDLALPEAGDLQGTLAADGLDARLAEPGATLRDAALTLRLKGSDGEFELAGAALASSEAPPLFPPLALSGGGALAGETLSFRGTARGLGGALTARATGGYDLAAGRGSAEVAVEPLVFQTGGLQPGDLSPLLASLERATGSLRVGGRLGLGDGAATAGKLVLEDLAFTAAGSRVEGLDLRLALDSLDPPASPPGQPFSIDRIDVGVPLTEVSGSLRLEPAGGASTVVIERARADFLDGRLALEDARIDPAAGRYDLTLLVERVDLSRLLALAELEEVSGSGQLSGAIPVSLVGGDLVIREGALAAEAPGVIAFRSEAAREALASGGEQVELMLQALEDFHYQVLRLSLDKPAEGDSRVFLKLEGANPEVLDGQPFVLNINLTSNAAPLLAALARGTEISDSLVEQLLQGRQR